MRPPTTGPHPAHRSTGVYQPNPVAMAQVVLSNRSSSPYCGVQAARPTVDALTDADLAAGVEQDDHLGVPVGPGRGDVQFTSPCGHCPVDAPQSIASTERANPSELSPFTRPPRPVQPDEPRRAWYGINCLETFAQRQRADAQRLGRRHWHPVGTQDRSSDHLRLLELPDPPALRPYADLQRDRSVRDRLGNSRVNRVIAEPPRPRQSSDDQVDVRIQRTVHPQSVGRCLPLEQHIHVELGMDVRLLAGPEEPSPDSHDRQRETEHCHVRSAGEYGDHEQPSRDSDRPDLRVRRPPVHSEASWTLPVATVGGAGTEPSTVRTTVAPVTSCSHSSGRTVIRCASAGMATAFTSSGTT